MPNFNKKITETNIRIGEVRFSYVNVFQRRRNSDGTEGKYSLAVLVPKTDTVAVKMIKEAVDAAKLKGKSDKWGGKMPANVKLCLRDGDEECPDDEAYAGHYFINCNTQTKPGVRVLENGASFEALSDEDFYSGCYGAVTINFFPYENSGNRGVAAGLNNCIKTRDGERLGGGRSADEDFGDLCDDVLS